MRTRREEIAADKRNTCEVSFNVNVGGGLCGRVHSMFDPRYSFAPVEYENDDDG